MRCLALIPFAVLIVWSALASANDAVASPAYIVLDEACSQLREDFNRAQGSVRLVFVVDPICPGCLRGLDDLDAALLKDTQDPRLQTFVVHVPVLKPPAKTKDIAAAAALLHNAHIRHYWNPSGSFGWALSEAVGLKRGAETVYAWDVWLIYGPETRWEGTAPPQPKQLMHQLRALRGSRFAPLDREAFAREVHQLLAQLLPAKGTP